MGTVKHQGTPQARSAPARGALPFILLHVGPDVLPAHRAAAVNPRDVMLRPQSNTVVMGDMDLVQTSVHPRSVCAPTAATPTWHNPNAIHGVVMQ